MTSSNDNEELSTLRYFMTCYWHQNAELVDGDLSATAEVFAFQEKPTMLRGLLFGLAEVRERGLFPPCWPTKGPLHDFWTDMGDRALSEEEAGLIAEVVGRHLM